MHFQDRGHPVPVGISGRKLTVLVIVRALASFLQHVGLIKREELEGDEPKGVHFEKLFEKQVEAYGSKLGKKSRSSVRYL